MLEPPRTSAQHPVYLVAPVTMWIESFPCNDVDREGSVQSNHPELMGQNSTHLAISVMMWFEKVRGGSMCLNHQKLVHKNTTHLASPVKI